VRRAVQMTDPEVQNLWALVRRLLGSSGGGSSLVNLSRVLVVDGGFTGTPTGNIEAPYPTIGAALAQFQVGGSIGVPLTAEDAQSLYVIAVMPCLGGYTSEGGTLTIPAWRNIVLSGVWGGSGFAGSELGLNVSATAIWDNSNPGHGAVPPTSLASLTIDNLALSGGLTGSDDNTVFGAVTFTGQTLAFGLGGAFDTSAGQRMTPLSLRGVSVPSIDTGGTAALTTTDADVSGTIGAAHPPGILTVNGGNVQGPVTVTASVEAGPATRPLSFDGGVTTGSITQEGGSITGPIVVSAFFGATGSAVDGDVTSADVLDLVDCQIGSGTHAASTGSYRGCTFIGEVTLSAGTYTFDGPSYRSFFYAGGVQGPAVILVEGGYQAGAVSAQATLPDADVSISLNGQAPGTTPAFAQGGNRYVMPLGTASTVRTISILTGGGEKEGDTICVVIQLQGQPVRVMSVFASSVSMGASELLTAIFRVTGGEWTPENFGLALP